MPFQLQNARFLGPRISAPSSALLSLTSTDCESEAHLVLSLGFLSIVFLSSVAHFTSIPGGVPLFCLISGFYFYHLKIIIKKKRLSPNRRQCGVLDSHGSSSALCPGSAQVLNSHDPAPSANTFHTTLDELLPPASSEHVWRFKRRLLMWGSRRTFPTSLVSFLYSFRSEVLEQSAPPVMSIFQTWTQISSPKSTVLKIAVDG